MLKKKTYIAIAILLVVLILAIYWWRFMAGPYKFDRTIHSDNLTACGESLVRHGDFEQTSFENVWSISDNRSQSQGDIRSDVQNYIAVGLDGSRGIAFSLSPDNQFGLVEQHLVFEELPEALLIQGWVKTEELDTVGPGSAVIAIYCRNPDMMNDWRGRDIYGLLAKAKSSSLTGSTPWMRVSFGIVVPRKTSEILIVGKAAGIKGNVFFDNIEAYPARKTTIRMRSATSP